MKLAICFIFSTITLITSCLRPPTSTCIIPSLSEKKGELKPVISTFFENEFILNGNVSYSISDYINVQTHIESHDFDIKSIGGNLGIYTQLHKSIRTGLHIGYEYAHFIYEPKFKNVDQYYQLKQNPHRLPYAYWQLYKSNKLKSNKLGIMIKGEYFDIKAYDEFNFTSNQLKFHEQGIFLKPSIFFQHEFPNNLQVLIMYTNTQVISFFQQGDLQLQQNVYGNIGLGLSYPFYTKQ